MQISFITPTLNEEKNIKRVIKQYDVLKGKYTFEIIIADGGSEDNTVKLAKKFGAKVTTNKRKKQTIAMNRNKGASIAKGNILVFCDADTLHENVILFAETILNTFKEKEIIAGMPSIKVFPEERTIPDKIFHFIYNKTIKMSFPSKSPFGSGQCQIIRKKIFEKVHGYDEKKVHGEDSYLFKEIRKYGELYHFTDLVIFESPRRYREIGYSKLILTALYSLLGQAIFKKNVLDEWKRVG